MMNWLLQAMDWSVTLYLAWFLLHATWLPFAVMAVAFPLLVLFRERPRTAYVIAMAGLFLALLAPLTLSVVTAPKVESLADSKVKTQAASGVDAGIRKVAERDFETSTYPAISSEDEIPMTLASAREKYQESANVPVTWSERLEVAQRWARWAVPLWLVGVIALSLRHLGGWILSHQITECADRIQNHELLRRFEGLLKQMRVRTDVALRQSRKILTPMVVGVFQTTIVLPASMMTSLSPDHWEAILAHELAHIRRHDFVWNLVQVVIETMLFFNPAVWWMGRQVRQQREFCCDDMSSISAGREFALAEGLAILLGQLEAKPPTIVVAATGETDRIALRRVRRLLAKKRNEPRSISPAATWVVGLGVILTLVSLGPLRSQTKPVVEHGSAALQQTTTESPEASQASEPESWEISKKYDAAWLRQRLLYHETLPDKIVVPAMRGMVLSPEGKPLKGVSIHSHTPRQWLRLLGNGTIKTNRHDPTTTSRAGGKFGLPERKEPYRVLFLHEQGVASVSHEELLYSDGRVQLKRWARIEGQFKMDGEHQAGQPIRLYIDTLPWSYTRGGPRLTTDYTTKTDANGKFVFEKVPPLDGRVHAVGRPLNTRHNVRYTCRSGETTRVHLGRGRTIRGKLAIASLGDGERFALWNDGDQVVVTRDLPEPPYPDDLRSPEKTAARREWRKSWAKTKAGFAFNDEQFQLANLNYYGRVQSNGQFAVHGVPAGPMKLRLFTKKSSLRMAEQVRFKVDAEVGDDIDLGTIVTGQRPSDPDKRARSGRALPSIRVRTVDEQQQPLAGVNVFVYDRNHYMAGGEVEFERIDGRTGENGWVDLGPLPQEYFCVQTGASGNVSGGYAVLSRYGNEFQHTKPARPNVLLETTKEFLNVTFVFREHCPIDFKPVDAANGEPLQFVDIFYFDQNAERWWNVAVVDGGGQHAFSHFFSGLVDCPMRASGAGYEPVDFRIAGPLQPDETYVQRIEIKRREDVRLRIVAPDGTLASGARIKFVYPQGLDCFSDFPNAVDDKGTLIIPYPPHPDVGTLQVSHASGSANVKLTRLRETQPMELDDRKVLPLDVRLQK